IGPQPETRHAPRRDEVELAELSHLRIDTTLYPRKRSGGKAGPVRLAPGLHIQNECPTVWVDLEAMQNAVPSTSSRAVDEIERGHHEPVELLDIRNRPRHIAAQWVQDETRQSHDPNSPSPFSSLINPLRMKRRAWRR